jgi:hypothetical protein
MRMVSAAEGVSQDESWANRMILTSSLFPRVPVRCWLAVVIRNCAVGTPQNGLSEPTATERRYKLFLSESLAPGNHQGIA